MPGWTAAERWMITASVMDEVTQIRSPNVSTAQRITSSAGATASSSAACSARVRLCSGSSTLFRRARGRLFTSAEAFSGSRSKELDSEGKVMDQVAAIEPPRLVEQAENPSQAHLLHPPRRAPDRACRV